MTPDGEVGLAASDTVPADRVDVAVDTGHCERVIRAAPGPRAPGAGGPRGEPGRTAVRDEGRPRGGG